MTWAKKRPHGGFKVAPLTTKEPRLMFQRTKLASNFERFIEIHLSWQLKVMYSAVTGIKGGFRDPKITGSINHLQL